MCVPLGGRGRSHSGSIKTTIRKEEVERILSNQTFSICEWKPSRCRLYRECDVAIDELIVALKDEKTKVSVANTFRDEYKRGFRTVVMEAPSMKATVLFRIKK